jgi:hypothetical protein
VTLRIFRRERPYPVPGAAAAAGCVLLVLGLVVAWADVNGGPVLCPFRHTTGLPCPSCGLLRAAGSLMRGDVTGAFVVNPLDSLLLLAAPPALAVLALTNRAGGKALRVDVSRRERIALWSLLAAVILANWAYVLVTRA